MVRPENAAGPDHTQEGGGFSVERLVEGSGRRYHQRGTWGDDQLRLDRRAESSRRSLGPWGSRVGVVWVMGSGWN